MTQAFKVPIFELVFGRVQGPRVHIRVLSSVYEIVGVELGVEIQGGLNLRIP